MVATQVVGSHTVREVMDRTDEIFGRSSLPQAVRVPSDEEFGFRDKLVALSMERRTHDFNECADVDATAFVTDDEFKALIAEAESLATP